ncbi:MAG: HlyD family efflux transporter periplasmic adaptor subunit [Myxococcales bacterium]|nr:HlyD family efflux transporter periplasmic adaptor subunit [Myxococcales bacterium]
MIRIDDGNAVAEDLALELVPRSRALRIASRLVVCAFLLAAAALWLAPWQQSVTGSGRVIAYAPLDRQQSIRTPIAGRLVRWHVQEGDAVRAGQLLATIEDNDPGLAGRLARVRDTAEARLVAAQQSVVVLSEQIRSLESAHLSAVDAAARRVAMGVERLRAAEQSRDAAVAASRAAELNLARIKELAQDGLSSTRELELAELAAQTTAAEIERANANVRAARGEISALEAERRRTDATMKADIDRARATLQTARSDAARAEGELQERATAVARQDTMQVVAPRDGTILRMLAAQGAEYVAAGDAIATLVPDTSSRAVELFMSGRDGPLVSPGRKVRLQFEGWPAVQFVGWPSVAVGTFPGVVAFVDAAADPQGRVRVVVVPDPAAEPWPSGPLLRQGIRVNGWVLLDRVRLGFELWRQWNGFPPSTSVPALSEPAKGAK